VIAARRRKQRLIRAARLQEIEERLLGIEHRVNLTRP
jgi:hypothetical protein